MLALVVIHSLGFQRSFRQEVKMTICNASRSFLVRPLPKLLLVLHNLHAPTAACVNDRSGRAPHACSICKQMLFLHVSERSHHDGTFRLAVLSFEQVYQIIHLVLLLFRLSPLYDGCEFFSV